MRSESRQRRPFFRVLSTRSLSLLLLAQLACLFAWWLAWPAPTAPLATSPVDLSFIVPQEEVGYWQELIEDFEQTHQDINIVLASENPNTDTRRDIYNFDFQLGEAKYDLVYMDIIWTAQFKDNLVALDKWMKRDDIDRSGFIESELEAGKIDGYQYRLPMRADIGLLYYRKEQWATQPQPQGLNIATELSQLRQSWPNSSQGYLWQGSEYEGLVVNFVEAMSSFEGAYWIDFNEQEPVGLTQPKTIEAITALQQLIEQGISPEAVTDLTEQSSLEAFKAGQATVLRGWPYFNTELQRLDWRDEIGMALPLSLSSQPSKGCRGGWGFGIPKNAAHQKEAWEAIKFFTSEAAQKRFILASGYLPSRTALFQDEDIVEKYREMPRLLEYVNESSVFRPTLSNYKEVSKILYEALHEILSEQGSVEEIMAKAQEATKRELGLG